MISIVILNWNSGRYLEEALDAIARQDVPDWELIVVDNGSTNESLATLADRESRGLVHKVVRLSTNVGFAEGMNRGIAVATGDVIVALNSDACVAPNFVRTIAEAARSARAREDNVGMFAIPIYDWDYGDDHSTFTDRIQVAGVSVVRRMTVCTWIPGVDARTELIGPSGAVVILTREAAEAARALTGFVYDSSYFAYAEDMDLFMRLYALGFKVEVVSGTRAWHIGSASTAQLVALHRKPMRLQALAHANKWRTWLKLGGWRTRLSSLPWILLDDILRLVRGPARAALLRAYLKNYRTLMSSPALRYPTVRYPFSGNMFSRSTPLRWPR